LTVLGGTRNHRWLCELCQAGDQNTGYGLSLDEVEQALA
jgi:hypothetical protein